jgi:putative transposase
MVKKCGPKGRRKIGSKTVRNMLTWSHYKFRQHLVHKAFERNINLRLVDEAFTSKTCGQCGWIDDKLGSRKVFKCTDCWSVMDRDFNGARNVLLKWLSDRIDVQKRSNWIFGAYPLQLENES